MTTVIAFPAKTYSAKLVELACSGLSIKIAGTLDGYIDFALTGADGSYRTYSLTRDDAHRLIAGLHTVIADIEQNCLFDHDALLLK